MENSVIEAKQLLENLMEKRDLLLVGLDVVGVELSCLYLVQYKK